MNTVTKESFRDFLVSSYNSVREDHFLLLYCSVAKRRGRIADLAPAFCRVWEAFLQCVDMHLKLEPTAFPETFSLYDEALWAECVKDMNDFCSTLMNFKAYNANKLKEEIAEHYTCINIELTRMMLAMDCDDDNFEDDYDEFVSRQRTAASKKSLREYLVPKIICIFATGNITNLIYNNYARDSILC